MANSNNVYATEQPNQANISDWVNNQEQMGFAYREEERKLAAIAEAKKAADEKKKQELQASYDLKTPKSTGIASFDQAYVEFVGDAQNKLLELYKKEKSGALSPEDYALKKNLLSLPESLELMSKSYTENNRLYLEGVKAGNHRDPDYEKTLLALQNNAKPFLDRNGNPVIGIDKDGDGNVDFMESTFSGLSIQPRLVKNIDYDKEIKAISDTLAVERNVTDQNFRKKTGEALPLTVAKAAATNAIYNEDGTPSEFAISQLYGTKSDQITKEQLDGLQKKVTQSLLDSKKRIKEEDVDYSGMNAAQRERRQAKAKTGKEEKVYSLNDLSLTSRQKETTKNGDGAITKEAYTANLYQGNVKIERKTGNATEAFKSFGVDKDGNVFVKVDVSEKTDTGNRIISKKYTSDKNNADVAFFAQRFKDPETGEFVKDVNELKEKLNLRGKQQLGTPEKKTINGF